jgi:hypothetical protein
VEVSKNMGQSYEGLAPDQRLIHYRLSAQDALEKAQRAKNPELRAGFLTMAQGWQALAAEVERQMRNGTPRRSPDDDATVELSG